MPKKHPRIKISNNLRHKVLDAAREQRKNPTKSEKILWQALRGKKLDGIKFRRQQPIGVYIADFYSSEYRLVIEVDGGIHEFQQEEDAERVETMKTLGLNVLRLSAELIEKDLAVALERIRKVIRGLSDEQNEVYF